MKKILLILLLTIPFIGFGQGWEKIFGGTDWDQGHSVQQTTDGGYIITGYINYNGPSDVYLVKTDQNGDTMWTKTFGGINQDGGYSVQQTSDGGYIITGTTESFGNGSWDVYLIKTDGNGVEQWIKTFGGTGLDRSQSVQQTDDGGYIITGSTSSFGNGMWDVYLIKTNSTGDSLWTKTFGGVNEDVGTSVKQTTDGGYIVTGSKEGIGNGFGDVWLIKTNSTGDSLWTKTFGGVNQDCGFSVQQTTDSGYVITGWTNSFGNGSWDVYLIKTNSTGDSLWTKTFGGTGQERGYYGQQTTDGGYIITGSGFGDVWLIKTNSIGDSLWTKTFGGTNMDYGECVQQTTDGGYIITGSTRSFDTTSPSYIYLIKTDVNGNITIPSWDCNGSSCVNPGTGFGLYSDSLVCVSNCVPTNIIEKKNTTTPKIIKITDVLGRENIGGKRKVMFYIYDDGSIDKKLIIEN